MHALCIARGLECERQHITIFFVAFPPPLGYWNIDQTDRESGVKWSQDHICIQITYMILTPFHIIEIIIGTLEMVHKTCV